MAVLTTDFPGPDEATEAVTRTLDERRTLIPTRARYGRETDENAVLVNLAHRFTRPSPITGMSRLMRYLSDVNLRAVLSILVARAGGTVDISNADLYAAMLPGEGRSEGFAVAETGTGIRISLATGPGADTPGRQ